MIRAARVKDAEQLSKLMFIIWRDMELPFIVHNDEDKVLKVIEQSIVEGEYRNNYKHIHVYEIDGQVAGFINCYAGDKEPQLESNWLNIDFNESFELDGTPLPEREADNGDLYIESIAVFEAYRGRGIASQLMTYIFDKARVTGYKQVSLNCEVDNEGAMKLYEKLGFKPLHDHILSGHAYKYLGKQV